MYRVRRPDGSLTDMVNLTRAKDALQAWSQGSARRRIVVVDGDRRPIGIVVARDDEFEAITPLDGSLGFYPTAEEAAGELWRRDRTGCWTLIGEATDRVLHHVAAGCEP
jgi:hypothetical protein